MSRWVDIRIAAEDSMDVQALLGAVFAPVNMAIDMNPPAAGPEWEFRIQDHGEDEVRKVIESAGYTILAMRTRLDRDMEMMMSEFEHIGDRTIDSCHERVSCPRCGAPIGKRCRRMPRGYRDDDLDDPLLMTKNPHKQRWTQEVPER